MEEGAYAPLPNICVHTLTVCLVGMISGRVEKKKKKKKRKIGEKMVGRRERKLLRLGYFSPEKKTSAFFFTLQKVFFALLVHSHSKSNT